MSTCSTSAKTTLKPTGTGSLMTATSLDCADHLCQKRDCDDCGGDAFQVQAEFEFLDTLSPETCTKLRAFGWDPEKGNPVGHFDQDGDSLLHCAARHDMVGVLKDLLDMGAEADLLCQAECGCTPLMVACRYCNLKSARLLIERGASPKRLNCAGETLMEQVADRARGSEQDKVRLLALLQSKTGHCCKAATYFDQQGDSLLHAAARLGLAEVLEDLLKSGAQANVLCRSDCECTPLMVACCFRNVECARVLLQHGAVAEHVNERGEKALDQATVLARGSEHDKRRACCA